jgi:GT2 family glycosyltransferase
MSRRPVQVVVVAYGAAESLGRALAALDGRPPAIVVDNSQSAAVAAVVLEHGAAYLPQEENRGFGAGVNVALRALLGGPPCDVLLVNPDAIVSPECAAALADALDRDPTVAAVAPELQGEDGSSERVEWPFPSPWRAWLEAIGLGGLPSRATFVVGAVLLLRWEALEEVGLFDETFFLYAEETDWQRRAGRKRWRSRQEPGAVALHRGAGTSTDPVHRELLFHAGQERYIRKWYGGGGWLVYRAAVIAGASVRAVVLPRPRRSDARRRLRLYLRGPGRTLAARV